MWSLEGIKQVLIKLDCCTYLITPNFLFTAQHLFLSNSLELCLKPISEKTIVKCEKHFFKV